MPAIRHKSLTIKDTKALGRALIAVSDAYPTRFLTETDFFPLVVAYLSGRVPALRPEAIVSDGAVDFRIGGTNPALLELVVAPRELRDFRHKELSFPGHGAAPQLYATQNRPELNKLRSVPQAQAKNRYLLLLDFRDVHDLTRLRESYAKEVSAVKGQGVIRVIYVSRHRECDFSI